MMLMCILSVPVFAAASSDSAGSACAKRHLIIAIDIGHTLEAPGAISATGRTEYAFNRDLAHRLVDQFHHIGVSGAFLVDDTGASIDLWTRPRRAQERGAHLLLSIHHDSVQPRYLQTWRVDGRDQRHSEAFSGYSLFVSSKNLYREESLAVAQAMGRGLRAWGLSPSLHHAEPIAGENKPLLDKDLGVYDYPNLVVLKGASMPAVLIEAGIIVNREDEQRLRDPFHQDMIVDAIIAGVMERCASLVGG